MPTIVLLTSTLRTKKYQERGAIYSPVTAPINSSGGYVLVTNLPLKSTFVLNDFTAAVYEIVGILSPKHIAHF